MHCPTLPFFLCLSVKPAQTQQPFFVWSVCLSVTVKQTQTQLTSGLSACVCQTSTFKHSNLLASVRLSNKHKPSYLPAFRSARVNFSFVFDSQFVQLDHLFAESVRVRDLRRLAFDQLSVNKFKFSPEDVLIKVTVTWGGVGNSQCHLRRCW